MRTRKGERVYPYLLVPLKFKMDSLCAYFGITLAWVKSCSVRSVTFNTENILEFWENVRRSVLIDTHTYIQTHTYTECHFEYGANLSDSFKWSFCSPFTDCEGKLLLNTCIHRHHWHRRLLFILNRINVNPIRIKMLSKKYEPFIRKTFVSVQTVSKTPNDIDLSIEPFLHIVIR